MNRLNLKSERGTGRSRKQRENGGSRASPLVNNEPSYDSESSESSQRVPWAERNSVGGLTDSMSSVSFTTVLPRENPATNIHSGTGSRSRNVRIIHQGAEQETVASDESVSVGSGEECGFHVIEQDGYYSSRHQNDAQLANDRSPGGEDRAPGSSSSVSASPESYTPQSPIDIPGRPYTESRAAGDWLSHTPSPQHDDSVEANGAASARGKASSQVASRAHRPRQMESSMLETKQPALGERGGRWATKSDKHISYSLVEVNGSNGSSAAATATSRVCAHKEATEGPPTFPGDEGDSTDIEDDSTDAALLGYDYESEGEENKPQSLALSGTKIVGSEVTAPLRSFTHASETSYKNEEAESRKKLWETSPKARMALLHELWSRSSGSQRSRCLLSIVNHRRTENNLAETLSAVLDPDHVNTSLVEDLELEPLSIANPNGTTPLRKSWSTYDLNDVVGFMGNQEKDMFIATVWSQLNGFS